MSYDKSTKADDVLYTPTEAKIIEVMMNPASVELNITEKCQMAGVSRQSWYNAIRRPEFQALVKQASQDMLRERIMDILGASIRTATTCGYRGYQDRRMLLEVAGLYRPENNLNVVATATQQPIIADDDDVQTKLVEMLGKYLPEAASDDKTPTL